jgi:hypothetical protein
MAPGEIVAVQLQEIESVQEGVPRALPTDRSPEPVEVAHTVRPAHHALAVDGNRGDPERSERVGDARHPVRPVMAATAEHPHPVQLAPADEPESVVHDLIGPLRPAWHGGAIGRQARLDEARRVADR